MANVHSLNDMEIGSSNPMQGDSQEVPDTFWETVKRVFCPKFTVRSITMLLILTNVALFLILELFSYVTKTYYTCVLYNAGALYPPDLRFFHLHRLIMPAFLHLNTTHILLNTVSACFLSFDPEDELGKKRFLILYFGSSLYGFLLSCVGLPTTLTAGASAALMGLVGYLLVKMFFKVQQMDTRSYGLFIVILFINFFFLLSSSDGNGYAHVGGMIFGALFTLLQTAVPLQQCANIANWQKWAKTGLIVYPVVIVIGFVVFLKPHQPIC